MKILVAVDGSKSSLNAVKCAVKLASNFRTQDRITLINVHDDQGLRHAQQFVGKEGIADYLRELSEKELKSALAVLVKAGVKHDSIIHTGHVAQVISDVANKKFDMVVMGTKGRSGLIDMLVGSVAQRVLSTCKKPVLLVK
ncbi:universal stress protein [Limnohabitans sp.]|uniref:universal stress protein n=1 Tax=Limnohabitans sp. TaxID=1907725 RepID=UPI002FDEA04B